VSWRNSAGVRAPAAIYEAQAHAAPLNRESCHGGGLNVHQRG